MFVCIIQCVAVGWAFGRWLIHILSAASFYCDMFEWTFVQYVMVWHLFELPTLNGKPLQPPNPESGGFLARLGPWIGMCRGWLCISRFLNNLTNNSRNAGADKMCDAVENKTGQRPWLLYRLCWCYFTPLICTVSSTNSTLTFNRS